MRKLLKRLNTQQKLTLLLVSILIVAQVWFDLLIPDYMADVVVLTQTPGNHVTEIWAIGLKMLGASLGSVGASIVSALLVERTAAQFSQALRSDLFLRINEFSQAEIQKFSTASLITRSTNDITQVQSLLSVSVWSLVRGPVMVTLALTKIAGKGEQWMTYTGIAILFMATILGIMLRLAIPKFKIIQELTDDITRVTRENLIGLPVIHATNSQVRAEAKSEKVNEKLTRTGLFVGRTFSIMFQLLILAINLLSVAIFWIGAGLIDNATQPNKLVIFSDMVVFSNYTVQIFMSFMVMSMVLFVYPRASVSAGRINEVLNTETSIKDGTGKPNPDRRGAIAFKNVDFRFPDASEDALTDINLTIAPGQTVGIIGATGSGKTALINLLTRFYDVTSGSVEIDGVDVRDMKLADLYAQIGYVTQQAVLFKGTVASNVTYGENTTQQQTAEQRVTDALEIAQIADYIANQPDGTQHEIAQAGKNLSGGQRQCLSIARAIAKQPQILIFDDSFSALDYKTDRLLRTALKEKTKGTTTLIVAQRVGSIRDADQIVVMDNGRITDIGTHTELMEKSTIYQEIANSQESHINDQQVGA